MEKPLAAVPGSPGRRHAALGGLFDALLLLASLLAIGVDVYLLQSDFRFLTRGLQLSGKQPEVGEIRNLERSVKARSAALPVWREIGDRERVRDKDQIFTGEQSSAQIVFDDGAVVDIGENTLVVIRRGEQTTRFDVRRGYLAARSGSKAGGLEIDIRGTRAKVGKGGELAVEANASGEASLTVLEGKAELSSKGKTVEVASNQRGSLRQDGSLESVQTLAFRLLSPARGATVYFGGGQSRQDLRWASLAGVSRYRIEVAQDPGMRKLVRSQESEAASAEVDLPEGTFYWRVAAINPGSGKVESSESRKLVRVAVRPPALWEPAPNAQVQYRETLGRGRDLAAAAGASVGFLWERVRGASGFRLQVAYDERFRDVVVERDVSVTRFHSDDLSPRPYYWRVQSLYEGREPSSWSAPRTFEVKAVPLPGVPEAELPSEGARVEMDQAPAAVELGWKEVRGAKGYLVEIARDEDFEAVLAKEQAKTTRLRWSPPRAGKYFWRVRALDAWNRSTRFGPGRSMVLVGGPLELLFPENEQTVTLVGERPRVLFRWKPAPLARRYRIEVAQDERFGRVVFEREVEQTEFAWEASGPGDYFWRVRSVFGEDDASAPRGGRRFSLTEKPLPPPPEVAPRYEIEAPARPARPKRRGGLDWLFPIRDAFAAEEPVEGKLRWSPSRGATAYRVEIARDDDFEEIVLRREVKGVELEWREAAPGKYFFRVAAVDADGRRGAFSQTSELLVRPPAPEPETTRGSHLILLGEEAALELEWKAAPGVEAYEVELARASERGKPFLRREVEGTRLETESPESGEYVWRVRGTGGETEQTRFTDWIPITITRQRPPSAPTSLASTASRAPDGRVQLRLDWSMVPGAVEYEVQLGRSARFSPRDRVIPTKKSGLRLAGAPKGYWRARARDRFKQWSPWSDAASLPDEPAPPAAAREIAALSATPGVPASPTDRRGSHVFLQLRAGFAPALEDYRLQTNVPTAFYSGPSPLGFSGDVELSWLSGWRARASYRQLRRTVFETAASAPSSSQDPLPLTRHQGRIEGGRSWGGALGAERLSLGLLAGIEARDLVAFRNDTSLTLSTAVASAILGSVSGQGAWRLSRRFWAEGEARYGYPFLVRGFTVASPLNLALSARLVWEAGNGLSASLGYSFELNRFQFRDFNVVSGGDVAGTLKDDRQWLLLTIGYRFGL